MGKRQTRTSGGSGEDEHGRDKGGGVSARQGESEEVDAPSGGGSVIDVAVGV